MESFKNDLRIRKSNTLAVHAEEAATEVSASPFSSIQDEPVDPTYHISSHHVTYIKTSLIDSPAVQQLLATCAGKSKVHNELLTLMRSTDNKSLKHRIATILVGQDNPSIASRLKEHGEEHYDHIPVAATTED